MDILKIESAGIRPLLPLHCHQGAELGTIFRFSDPVGNSCRASSSDFSKSTRLPCGYALCLLAFHDDDSINPLLRSQLDGNAVHPHGARRQRTFYPGRD